jgi:hypothetical protein
VIYFAVTDEIIGEVSGGVRENLKAAQKKLK